LNNWQDSASNRGQIPLITAGNEKQLLTQLFHSRFVLEKSTLF